MFGSVRVRTPHVMSGQRVGLMGGSFAPVHEGHLAAARTAMKRLALDQIWLIVTPGNPLKDQAGLPPLDARVGRVQAMIRDRRIRVTGFESTLGNAYTAVTLGFLVRRHKGVRFVWVMGADGLALFHHWRAWRQMARLVPMAIVGSRAAMAKGSPVIYPVTILIRLGEPVPTVGLTFDDRDRLMALVRERIVELLGGDAGQGAAAWNS